MSFRAALVDAFKQEETITCFTSDRITDRILRFEDFVNTRGNVDNFPAITIESVTWIRENNLDLHSQLILSQLRITCYTQINQQRLKSRDQSVRSKEQAIERRLDSLTDAVINFIIDKKKEDVGNYYLRSSDVLNNSDGIFQTDENREIITNEILYQVQYSVT